MINTTPPKKNMNWENIKKQCASLGTLLFCDIANSALGMRNSSVKINI